MYYDAIKISQINDFLFCPHSIYFHNLYQNYNEINYHSHYQKAGKIAHKTIDKKTYSTSKNILQSIEIYSFKYNLIGKIDLYYKDQKLLVERKKKIKKVFLGYKFQLFAQKLALEEMGYRVGKMQLYSLDDNKKYNVNLTEKEKIQFFQVLKDMRNFNIINNKLDYSEKCKNCIYQELCRKAKK